MDQLLIAAFYARKNTIIPVVVGMVSILGYLAVALPFWNTIGMPALAFANTVQNSVHAIILLVLLRVAIGHLRIRRDHSYGAEDTRGNCCDGDCSVGCADHHYGHFKVFSLDRLFGQLLTVAIAGGLAVLVYLGVVLLFRIEEVGLVKGAVMAKLGRK